MSRQNLGNHKYGQENVSVFHQLNFSSFCFFLIFFRILSGSHFLMENDVVEIHVLFWSSELLGFWLLGAFWFFFKAPRKLKQTRPHLLGGYVYSYIYPYSLVLKLCSVRSKIVVRIFIVARCPRLFGLFFYSSICRTSSLPLPPFRVGRLAVIQLLEIISNNYLSHMLFSGDINIIFLNIPG